MSADAGAITEREGRGSSALWFGLLAGPIAWATQLVVNYVLEEWVACAPGSRTPGLVLGMGVAHWIVAVNAVLASVTALALIVSLRAYGRLRHTDESTGGRARWMSFAGIVNSAVFLLPIVLGFAPAALLDTCRPS